MTAIDNVLKGYENTKLLHYEDVTKDFPNAVLYEDLHDRAVTGVLKLNRHVDGKLTQVYSSQENHTLTIAATRLGKTTSCVIPSIISYASQKVKRPMIVSDPKGELYRLLSIFLKEQGYDVLLLNLRDYSHSELWNPLTDIFRLFQRAENLENEVELIETENGPRNRFMGQIYEKQAALDEALEQMREKLLIDVDGEIDRLIFKMIPMNNANDPYWTDAPRQWGKANIWAMLEQSSQKTCLKEMDLITEKTFSFDTMFRIIESLTPDNHYDDNNYFSARGESSRAYQYAKGVIDNASNTRQCIMSCFMSATQIYRSSTIRLITATTSFDMKRLIGDKPVVVFISYPDETKVYYRIISDFVKNAYTYLINYANEQPSGKLAKPFYFMLDEFGNFPKIDDFETVISACGGRNIWFNIVLQSYAQLDNVYGQEIAAIIRDNLNIHIFLGSNNPSTLEEFSRECGKTTRIAPRSALNGNKDEIEYYDIETIPLVPISVLANLKPGECIIKEANSEYVFFSKMERYYLCKEFNNFTQSTDKDYVSSVNPLDKKYIYTFMKRKRKYDFDF